MVTRKASAIVDAVEALAHRDAANAFVAAINGAILEHGLSVEDFAKTTHVHKVAIVDDQARGIVLTVAYDFGAVLTRDELSVQVASAQAKRGATHNA